MRNLILMVMFVFLSFPDICISEITSKIWMLNTNSVHSELNTLKSSKTSTPSIKSSLWQTVESQGIPPFYSYTFSNNSSDESYMSGLVHRAVPDLKYAFKTTISDFVYIYSSPARWNASDRKLALGALILGGAIYVFDQQIYDALNSHKNDWSYKPVRKVGEFFEPLGYMGFTNKYLFLSIFIGYIFEIEPMVEISADILESFVIAAVADNGANLIVGRRRPSVGFGSRSYVSGDGTSFPSGHSINVVQIASILSYHIDDPMFKIIAHSIAATVCLQRITSRAHWPSDVYGGALLGWYVSHKLLERKQNRKQKLQLTPVFQDDLQGVSIGLVYRF